MVTKFDPRKALAASKSWREQSQLTREKIRTTQIVNRLNDHVEGNNEMTPTQVKAAQILLDRVLPTISVQDVTQTTDNQANYQDMLKAFREMVEKQAGENAPQVLKMLGFDTQEVKH